MGLLIPYQTGFYWEEKEEEDAAATPALCSNGAFREDNHHSIEKTHLGESRVAAATITGRQCKKQMVRGKNLVPCLRNPPGSVVVLELYSNNHGDDISRRLLRWT
ncbi:hypothetical protein ElyMa_001621100 [Elysia marginata]|uniref:Uncharacterized protein n=1 Tax=Elysia marginata TaxID=1093978 RepID=A0AAV4JLQ9_9GAST|nr:hypothetical protein ElyMa_001621100 [Elysia marginata]